MNSGQDLILAFQEERKKLVQATEQMKQSGRYLATAERDYRIALRKEILRLHCEDGVAWTSCDNIAKGSEEVAQLRFRRDVHKSDYESWQEIINCTKLELRILEGEINTERRGQ